MGYEIEPRVTGTPINEYDALMRTMPHEDPEEPRADLDLIRDRVAMLLETIDPKLQWVINGIINEGKSLQDIADELSYTKTHIWRMRNEALDELRNIMMTDTVIRKRISPAKTWNDSCLQWVVYLATESKDSEPISIHDMDHLMDVIMSAHQNMDTNNTLERAIVAMAASTISSLRDRDEWDAGGAYNTLCDKQHDYGHGNINKFGIIGLIVRLSDKIERYKNLKNKNARIESISDTLFDIVGYCVLALMVMDGTFNLELETTNE